MDAPRDEIHVSSAPRRASRRTWLLLATTVVIVLTFAILYVLHAAKATWLKSACWTNIKQIDLAILLYQQDHKGQFPDSLGRLAETTDISADAFICPASDDERSPGPTTRAIADDINAGPAGHHCSFIYLGRGLTDRTVTATTVICYEPPSNHGDGSNVLFGDRHVEWETRAGLAKLLATTRPTQ